MNQPAPLPPSITVDTVWLPKQNSTLAESIDFGWDVVMVVSIMFFVLLMAMMIYFLVRYHRRSEFDVTSDRDHNARLEWAWTLIPLAICVGMRTRFMSAVQNA